MDRIGRQGAHLTRAFTVTPVCSPSRAGLMTSRHGTEVGITDWINHNWSRVQWEANIGLPTNLVTWPQLLLRHGYHTGLVGKWHLGVASRFHPTRFGYQEFYGFLGGGNSLKNASLEIHGADQNPEGFLTNVLTDAALDFIRRHQKQPFVLSVHYRAPHAPWLPLPEEDWSPYKDLDPVIPNPDYPDLDVEKVTTKMREYIGSVASVDRSVGRLLDLLDELKLTDNTVVIFTSDHGYNMGHNGIWHKGNGHWITMAVRDMDSLDPDRQRPNLYDNSLLVPAVIRWPGIIQPGIVIDQTVTNLDWYPTLMAMAGIDIPGDVQIRGRNFVPLLKSESIPWDNDLYAQYSQHHYVQTHMRCIRTPEWKLIRDFKRPGKSELYDLKNDPAETKNVVNTGKYASIRDDLDAKLLAKMRELDDPALHHADANARP
jgi:uncharacterized sulfatase